MPVINWNRLESRPRSPEIERGLAAKIRDPLWMLARQWQFGEFQGEDAGSPAYLEIQTRSAPIDRARLVGDSGPFTQLPKGAPLEVFAEAEAPTPDLSVRVELGQTWELLLDEASMNSLVDAFRTAYPLPASSTLDAHDAEALRFLSLCQGRAIDGVALYRAASKAAPDLPPEVAVAVPVPDRPKIRTAMEGFLSWVNDVLGEPGTNDAAAWTPERLAYEVEVAASTEPGFAAVFSAEPTRDGDFDWYSFDLREDQVDSDKDNFSDETLRILPMHVRFRGMPNARFWDFERGPTDFGAIEPQKRDLAKLVIMDFMLIHGNDWFVVPLEQNVGSISQISSLVVHDVFDAQTAIARADALPVGSPLERWSMFSTAIEGNDQDVAPFFILPPSPASAVQTGPTLEEVAFFRDEMAELAWGVERTVENGVGDGWIGHERDAASRPDKEDTPPPDVAGETEFGLQYVLETQVPIHWIPLVPISIDAVNGQIALERAAMVRDVGGELERVEPAGRILRPAVSPYHIAEEEVPRTGLVLSRVACRSRWIDGSTHLWIARRRGAGQGPGSSGLRYDDAAAIAE